MAGDVVDWIAVIATKAAELKKSTAIRGSDPCERNTEKVSPRVAART
jgi:hypothetical protein